MHILCFSLPHKYYMLNTPFCSLLFSHSTIYLSDPPISIYKEPVHSFLLVVSYSIECVYRNLVSLSFAVSNNAK